MNPRLRRGLLLVCGLLLVGGLAYVYTDLAKATEIYFSTDSSFEESLEFEERASERLETQRQAVQLSIVEKQAVIEDLISERLSFPQAVRAFQEINSLRPQLWMCYQFNHPGKNDQELNCAQVLSYLPLALRRTNETNLNERFAAFQKMANDYLQTLTVQ